MALSRVVLALVALCAVIDAAAAQTPRCPGISPATAQRLFDQLKSSRAPEGYRFEGLGTEKTRMVVLWSRQGRPCPELRVDVSNCGSHLTGAALELSVAPDFVSACPDLSPVIEGLRRTIAAERPVGQYLALPARLVAPLVTIAALLWILGLIVRRLLGHPWDSADAAWTAILVALAAPFFFNVLPALTLELGASWLVLMLLLVSDRGLRFRWLDSLAIFAVSTCLNVVLSSGGPGDLHLNLAAIWTPDIELRWGPGPIAGFRLLRAILGALDDRAIVWVNLLLASLVPAMLHRILLEFGLSRCAAMSAAVVIACHPLLIGFSGVLERQGPFLFAAVGGLLAFVRFLSRGRQSQLLACALGAMLATTSRPEGAQVLVLYVAALLVVPSERRRRAAASLVTATFIALASGYVHFALVSKAPGSHTPLGPLPLLSTVLFDRDFTPWAWAIAAVLGLGWGLRHRAAWLTILTVVGFDALWRVTNVYYMFVGQERQVASARYQTMLLVPLAFAMALFFQAVEAARPPLRWLVLVLVLAATIVGSARVYDNLLSDFTIDHEYRFLKRHLIGLQRGARLYVFDPPQDDIGFIGARAVGDFVGSSAESIDWSERDCEQLLATSAPTYLYVGSACAPLVAAPGHPLQPQYDQWLRDCETVRARLGGDVVEAIDVPAHKMSWHDFREKQVRLTLYRVTSVELCGIGPRRERSP